MRKEKPKTNDSIGYEMYALIERLFPITRSITGEGARETLRMVQEYVPIKINEVRSGASVFDWKVPNEWTIRDAYIKNSAGKKIIDFKKSNLHVVSYSAPVHTKLSLAELKKHLHTLPKHPNRIPYLTSYYAQNWGFCMTHNDFKKLKDGKYEARIDADLKSGALNYGEFYLPGKRKDEFLISTYICHPSLANDNLSGIALTTMLARELSRRVDRNYSYRFLFLPETIGAIVWLAKNKKTARNIKHGLVATCVGDSGKLTYKKSRQGNAGIDRAVQYVLRESKKKHHIMEFFPSGSDERQYCSPGFNLPVGSLMRTPYDEFPEYHTSADNLNFVKPRALADTFETYCAVINLVEQNATYKTTNPCGEPQLGKRGIYPTLGGAKNVTDAVMAMMWTLNLSDGTNSLLDIAERSGISFEDIRTQTDVLHKAGLLALAQKSKEKHRSYTIAFQKQFSPSTSFTDEALNQP